MTELPTLPALEEAEDRIRYRRVLAIAAGLVLAVFGVGAAVQSTLLQIIGAANTLAPPFDVPIVARLLANAAAVFPITLAVWLVPHNQLRRWVQYGLLLAFCLGGALLRAGAQALLGIYPLDRPALFGLDLLSAVCAAAFSVLVGLAIAEYQQRQRLEERQSAVQALRAASALEALQGEELRVRQEVAEGLHGTVQQALVILGVRLRQLSDDLAAEAPPTPEQRRELLSIHDELDRLREQDVRGMSQLLYPSGVDMGLAQAARMMLRRVPSTIALTVRIDDSVLEVDDPARARIPLPLRILAVRVLEEAVSNALRHGRAGALAVAVLVDEEGRLSIRVDDDGAGISEDSVPSGLARLRERLAEHGGTLQLDAASLGGTRLQMMLPLPRPDTEADAGPAE